MQRRTIITPLPLIDQRLLLLGRLPPQVRRYHGRQNGAQHQRAGQEQIGFLIVVLFENPPVDHREHDAEHLHHRVKHSARRPLGLGIRELSRQFVADGQIAGHEEPAQKGKLAVIFNYNVVLDNGGFQQFSNSFFLNRIVWPE